MIRALLVYVAALPTTRLVVVAYLAALAVVYLSVLAVMHSNARRRW